MEEKSSLENFVKCLMLTKATMYRTVAARSVSGKYKTQQYI